MRVWHGLFICAVTAFTVIGFQNCSGSGVTVGNPLSVLPDEKDKIVKVGFTAYQVPDVTTQICIGKVTMRSIEFYDPNVVYPGHTDPIDIGYVRDANSVVIGTMRARWVSGPDSDPVVYSKFNQEYRLITLTPSSETKVYELILPDGHYADLKFFASGGGNQCPDLIEERTIQTDNSFGTFVSMFTYWFPRTEPFEVLNDEPVYKNIDGQFLMTGMAQVQSDDELHDFMTENYEWYNPPPPKDK